MKCRKNIRKLIQEYNAAPPAAKPATALMRFRQALLSLKAAPSQLPAPHTQANRYDDYVYIHQQSMAGHPGNDPGRTRGIAARLLSLAPRVPAPLRKRPARGIGRPVDLPALLGLEP